jgi:hypothetical protein
MNIFYLMTDTRRFYCSECKPQKTLADVRIVMKRHIYLLCETHVVELIKELVNCSYVMKRALYDVLPEPPIREYTPLWEPWQGDAVQEE